jgi:hypothetical protein
VDLQHRQVTVFASFLRKAAEIVREEGRSVATAGAARYMLSLKARIRHAAPPVA